MRRLINLISFLLQCSRSIKHSRLIFTAIVLTGIISGVSNTALLALLNSALSKAGNNPASLAWAFAALCVALPLSRLASEALLIRMASGAVMDLRMHICRRVLSAPLRGLEEMGSHKVMAVLTDDIPSIIGAMSMLPQMIMHSAIIAGCMIYLGWLSPVMLLASVIFISLGIVTYQIPLVKAIKYMRLARDEWDSLIKHFRGLTEGTKELKLHRRRRATFLSSHLQTTSDALRRYGILSGTIAAAANSWGQSLFFVLIGLLVFVMPKVSVLDPQTMTGYSLALLYLMTPLQVILNIIPNLSRAGVAMQKIQDLGISLASTTAEATTDGESAPLAPYSRLELAGVTHTYYRENENSNFTLGPIDLAFEPGEVVFLTGGNGSGKTTLAKLITGLYSPESGTISFNGEPVNDKNRDSYRELFSVVFSDFFLFESLLGLDRPQLDAEASSYLTQLQLDRKLRIENGVLSTIDLSQGQRKRLALLTAYLEDRPFYVFDEWAADQDPLFRDIFYLQILPGLKSRGKTVLVISHDDRYYHLGDYIIRLDYGKLACEPLGAASKEVLAENSRSAV
jgi:putative ATP-binding cassette transporter